MQWSDAILYLLIAAIVLIMVLYLHLARKNKHLHRMAEEANRLRREADATEQRNRQLKQEMTSNIAHELKTPVSSIRGYLEIMLGDKPIDDTRRRHYIERCYKQTLRLSDLIQDVSLINKIEESTNLFQCEDTDVRAIAAEAIDELTDMAEAAHVHICNHLPAMPIHGNHELLYCIFRNLLENSIAYAGEGCTATIETYTPQGEVPTDYYHLHFYDNGCGVPDQYLSRLFDRFVRIGEGRSRSNGGSGLGLSIVKHAVLFHHGEIYTKNRQEGGLEFFFSLKLK